MIFDTLSPLPETYRGAIIAIGNFDGVHRGHQSLLETARKRALHLGRLFGVLTFEPHPRTLFRPNDPPFRLTPPAIKHERLKLTGADFVVTMPFTQDSINLTADDFIQTILINTLGAHSIVCGADFHFGKNRAGNIDNIEQHNIPCITLDPLRDAAGKIYSATRVRDELKTGNIKEANAILGWNWFINGIVENGDKRGRTIGYPTANIAIANIIAPAYGVYAATATHQNIDYKAAVNIGIRPMFEVKQPLLEAYIINFDQTIYGEDLRVTLIKKIRDEMKFDSLDELQNQIAKDVNDIKNITIL